MLSLGAVAFAADTSPKNITDVSTGNTAEVEVKLTANVDTEGTPTYYVTVSWDSMDFQWTSSGAPEWDHENHKWKTDEVTGTWTGGSESSGAAEATATITVVNHSSEAVAVASAYSSTTDYEDNTEHDGVTVDYTEIDDKDLVAGNEHNTGDGDNSSGVNDNVGKRTVKVSGNPKSTLSGTVAGTVTITVTSA